MKRTEIQILKKNVKYFICHFYIDYMLAKNIFYMLCSIRYVNIKKKSILNCNK